MSAESESVLLSGTTEDIEGAEYERASRSCSVTPSSSALDLQQEQALPPAPPRAPASSSSSSSSARIEIKSSDFLFGVTLGEGSYGRVLHARMKEGKMSVQKDYAVKIMDKALIRKENKTQLVINERNILVKFVHPFIIKLYYSFQDATSIYMCMDLAAGGELLGVILQSKRIKQAAGVEGEACDIPTTTFYVAEIIEALEFLHGHGVVHRDLKPENVLINAEGHIKVADFGAALVGEDEENAFEGTPEYVSPEVLASKMQTKACDLWALGCILYQMLTGTTPFRAETEYLIFERIKGHSDGSQPVEFPSSFPAAGSSLVVELLHAEGDQRLGAGDDANGNGYGALKGHIFFESTPWGRLVESTPPHIPDPSQFPNPEFLHDGVDDDWMFDGEATIIVNEAARPSEAQSPKTKWTPFLRQGENQVFTGLTLKRKGLFSKKRQLVLTDAPRLIYIDPDTMELKGEIPWDVQYPVSCTIVDEFRFDVLSPKTGRVYHLSDREAGSQMWVDLIDAMLVKQEHDQMQLA